MWLSDWIHWLDSMRTIISFQYASVGRWCIYYVRGNWSAVESQHTHLGVWHTCDGSLGAAVWIPPRALWWSDIERGKGWEEWGEGEYIDSTKMDSRGQEGLVFISLKKLLRRETLRVVRNDRNTHVCLDIHLLLHLLIHPPEHLYGLSTTYKLRSLYPSKSRYRNTTLELPYGKDQAMYNHMPK